jgi:hypothetical protein
MMDYQQSFCSRADWVDRRDTQLFNVLGLAEASSVEEGGVIVSLHKAGTRRCRAVTERASRQAVHVHPGGAPAPKHVPLRTTSLLQEEPRIGRCCIRVEIIRCRAEQACLSFRDMARHMTQSGTQAWYKLHRRVTGRMGVIRAAYACAQSTPPAHTLWVNTSRTRRSTGITQPYPLDIYIDDLLEELNDDHDTDGVHWQRPQARRRRMAVPPPSSARLC